MLHRLMLALTALVLLSGAPAQAANVLIGSSPPTQPAIVPVISGAGNSVPYVAAGSPVLIDASIIAGCNCSNLTGATVTISAGSFTGDALNFAGPAGITGSFSAGTLTLSGTASPALYTQALQSVTYFSSNADPTNSGSNPTRTITWQTANGGNNSNTPTSLINVSLAPATPTISSAGNTVTYTAGGSATVLDSSITTGCTCTNLTAATISISAGLLSGDLLNFTNQFSITGSYDATTGTLTLTGTDTKAHYNTALQSITYSSTLGDPTNAGNDVKRTVNWVVSNTTANSLPGSITTVNVQNLSQPTLSSVNNTVTYTSGGSAATLDNAIIVSCSCTNLTGFTVGITPATFFSGDQLNFTNQLGITGSYNVATGLLTLSGTTTLANYQTAVRTITYSSTSGDPTNGGSNPSRTMNWVAQNSTVNSNPASTFVSVFLAGQPTWALTGATAAVNGITNQCWINGSGTTTLSACLNVTRATTETCNATASTITYATTNTGCSTSQGLAVWGNYTNLVLSSFNAAGSSWGNGGAGFSTAGGSVTVTANAATGPDGVAAYPTVAINNGTARGPFGAALTVVTIPGTNTYSMGCWVKADTGGDVGKWVQLYSFGTNSVLNFQLPAAWTLIQKTNVETGTGTQLGVGYTSQAGFPALTGTQGTGAATFDLGPCQMEAGSVLHPILRTTTSATTTSGFDNVAAVSSSAFENAIDGAASSIIMVTTGGNQSVASTLVDSNGVTLLGETATNSLTTAVGSSTTTLNGSTWTGVTTSAIARNATGRSLGLNLGPLIRDAQATTIGKPISFGSTQGPTNPNTNPFNGYIQTINVFNTRIPDNQVGQLGSTKYYFADPVAPTGGGPLGNDANACTITAPCASITKVNSIGSINSGDQVNFNGGDTFTGCLRFKGGVNWTATRTAGATIQSYGTGQATLTPNCPAAQGQNAILFLGSTDGAVVNNLHFQGDTAGQISYGIALANCEGLVGQTHGNYTIQNNTFSGVNHQANDGGFTADLTVNAPTFCNGDFWMLDHLVALNNTAAGATINATDSPFLSNPGYACSSQWDAMQGNLIFNLGGNPVNAAYNVGSGILFEGGCPLGSIAGANNGGPSPNPTGAPSAIIQFNVVHDDGANSVSGCAFYNIWTSGTDSAVVRMNETYNAKNGAGCDHGAFDFDLTTTNSLTERNYSHNDAGPCLGMLSNGGNTFRWNICDNDGLNGASLVNTKETSATNWIYNNTFIQAPGHSTFLVNYNGCPGTGSIFANNIIVGQTAGTFSAFNMSKENQVGVCTPGPSGGLTISHNDWFTTGGGQFRCWVDGQGNPPNGVTGSYAQCATVTGETGGMNVNPQFSGAIGLNVTCNSTVGSPGPQASGCPTAYALASGSPLSAPAGATLTSAPYNLPTTIAGAPNKYNGQGTLSYYGSTLPCSQGGYPIGADCGSSVAPPPSFSLDFTTGSLPSCSGCNVAFAGGANASWYTASNVLHVGNSANSPRFDHNPSNGAVRGILLEPANTSLWSSSTATAATYYTAEGDHATLGQYTPNASNTGLVATNPCPGTSPAAPCTSFADVWGTGGAQNTTGPDNVANSASTFTVDSCTFPTSNTATPNPAPNCSGNGQVGDGGHPSVNALFDGCCGSNSNSVASNTVVVSAYVQSTATASDAIYSLTMFLIDASSNTCFLDINMGTGGYGTQDTPPGIRANGSNTCATGWPGGPASPQSIAISGNNWLRIASTNTINTSAVPARLNISLAPQTAGANPWTGDGHSGIRFYGLMVSPAATTSPANSFIPNTTVTGTASSTADALTFTVPAGLCHLTYTFDNNATQVLTLNAPCSTTATNFSSPTWPTLTRPWVKTIVGST